MADRVHSVVRQTKARILGGLTKLPGKTAATTTRMGCGTGWELGVIADNLINIGKHMVPKSA